MNGTNVVLDTNIVLYLLQGSDELEHLLQGTNIFVSVITKVELLSHPALDGPGEQVIHDLLAQTTVLEFSPAIQDRTVDLRKRYKLKLPDAMIAATAHFLNVQLITADKRFTKLADELPVLLIER